MSLAIGIVVLAAIMFYAGFVTGWREREEKYWHDLALLEAKIASSEPKGES